MSHQPYHRVTKVSDFTSLSELVKSLDCKSLFLFDIDDVVLMDTDEYRLTHPYREKLIGSIRARLTKPEHHLLYSIILKDRTVRFVNPDFQNIFIELCEREIPTMALTKLYTGPFGVIEDFTDWRIKELKTLNIDFSKSTPIKDHILLEEFSVGRGTPTLKEGVILTANADKGIVLENILAKGNYIPDTIVFVDDVFENVESVQKTCEKLNINYYGLEFDGASLVPEVDLCNEAENKRFYILEHEKLWCTDY